MVLDYGICSSDSSDTREDLYVELLCDDVQFGEIFFDESARRFRIKIYPPLDAGSWEFELDDFHNLIESALKQFKQLDGIG